MAVLYDLNLSATKNSMINVILALGGIALLIIVIEAVYYLLHNDNKAPNEKGKLKYPISYRYLPLLFVLAMGCMSVMSVVTKSEDWLATLTLSLIIEIPALLLFICFSLWGVKVYEDRFSYSNFIGRKKTYFFKDIEERQVGKWYSKITQRKVFTMPYFIPNGKLLRRRYEKFRSKNRERTND